MNISSISIEWKSIVFSFIEKFHVSEKNILGLYYSLNRDSDHSWGVHGEGINREWSRALYYDRRN